MDVVKTLEGAGNKREVLRKMETKMAFILRIKRWQLNILGHIMWEAGLEALTRYTEGKGDSEIHRAIYLKSLHEWILEEGGKDGTIIISESCNGQEDVADRVFLCSEGHGT